MSCLKIAIVLTFCLQGFPLSGDSDSCLSFNKVNKTCECCRSGWTGQDCKTECPNCGRRFVRKKCETFCQNGSFYGTFCNLPCPSECLDQGHCNTSCAKRQESQKDINQGRADSEETGTGASSHRLGSKGDTTVGALITIAICAVLFVAYKYGKVCVKCWKQLKDKLGSCKFNNSRSGEPAERDPLTSVVEVADSSTKRETPVAQPQSPLHHDVNSQSIDGLPWPQRCEEDMVPSMQGKYSEDDSGQFFHIH